MTGKDLLRYAPLIEETLDRLEKVSSVQREEGHRANTFARCKELISSLPPWVLRNHSMLIQWFEVIYEFPDNATANMLEVIDTTWQIQERMSKLNPDMPVPSKYT